MTPQDVAATWQTGRTASKKMQDACRIGGFAVVLVT